MSTLIVAGGFAMASQARSESAGAINNILTGTKQSPPDADTPPMEEAPSPGEQPAPQDTPAAGTEPAVDASPKTIVKSSKELVALGTQATVVVLSMSNGQPTGVGSGFFISPTTIVTNSHVVEDDDQFLVLLPGGGRMEAVLSAKGGSQTGNDIALLTVASTDGITPLALATHYETLENVYSFGYPITAIKDSAAWTAVMNGDKNVKLPPVVSSGTIQQVTMNTKNIEVLMHSAKISGGNSGGSLLDACGRVVGINTYLMLDNAPVVDSSGQTITVGNGTEQSGVVAQFASDYGVAVASTAFQRFLEGHSVGTDAVFTSDECK